MRTHRLLWIGDLHLRGTNPRNRLDDYRAAVKAKLREVFELAAQHDVSAILCAGDIWDRPEVSIGVLLEFVDVFAECPCAFYTTAGNHDIYGYNVDTYWRTSLALLERLVDQVIVVNNPGEVVSLAQNDVMVQVTFTPYSAKIDHAGYGYSPQVLLDDHFKIHVAHGMLLDHAPPFDRFTLVQDVQTDADLVLTGHDHIGYGLFRRPDGKVFLNCGSLTRLSASIGEIERSIQAALITVQPNKQFDIELIPLRSAGPGSEVLDRTKIEEEKARQYAMDTFAALIQGRTGEKVLLNIDQIVEEIAAHEQIKPNIVNLALQFINEQRMGA